MANGAAIAVESDAGAEPRPARAPRVAYLINQYPLTSHSFVRREIHAVEAAGTEVLRYSQRGPGSNPLPTEADREEVPRTRVILDAGVVAHGAAVLAQAARSPTAFARALALALRLGATSWRTLALHMAYFAEACVLERWLAREGVEHLHAHFGTNSTSVAAICHALGGPRFSFTVHGPEEFDKPELLALGEKVRRAAFAVAISDYGRAQLSRWARHEDWSKIEVVRCGVDEELLGAPATPVPEAPRLVCVGRLSEQKGHLLLLDAVARLAGEGLAFELVLVGDGPLRSRIEEIVRARGLERHVRLAGWMGASDVRAEILASRALVLSSFAEGLPVVIMEAFALARPVIATAIAGIPELVEPGVNGWIVPAGSADALARAMRDVLRTSAARLGAMGRDGAERVARCHSARTEGRKLAELFASAQSRS